MRRIAHGFTLVEVVVITPVLIITAVILVSMLVSVLSQISIARVRTGAIYDNQAALDLIEKDLSVNALYLTTNDSGYSDSYGPDNAGAAWSYKGSSATSRVLLARSFATTLSPYNSSKAPVFINQLGCSTADLYYNQAYMVNLIYFVRGGTLYRRTLTNPSHTLCSTPYQQRSCPSDATWVSGCSVEDTIIATNVQSFAVAYYLNPIDSTAVDVYSSTDPNVLEGYETAEVTLGIRRTYGGEIIDTSKSIRVSRLKE